MRIPLDFGKAPAMPPAQMKVGGPSAAPAHPGSRPNPFAKFVKMVDSVKASANDGFGRVQRNAANIVRRFSKQQQDKPVTIDLNGSKHFPGVIVPNLDVSYGNLNNGNFEEAHLPNGKFIFANMNYVDLANSNLNGGDFSASRLNYADMTGCTARKCNFSEADLKGAMLFQANLRGSDFSGANMQDAYLVDSNLSDTIWTGANLTGATFDERTTVSGADFRGLLI